MTKKRKTLFKYYDLVQWKIALFHPGNRRYYIKQGMVVGAIDKCACHGRYLTVLVIPDNCTEDTHYNLHRINEKKCEVIGKALTIEEAATGPIPMYRRMLRKYDKPVVYEIKDMLRMSYIQH